MVVFGSLRCGTAEVLGGTGDTTGGAGDAGSECRFGINGVASEMLDEAEDVVETKDEGGELIDSLRPISS